MCPYATTTEMSGASACSAASNSGPRGRSGWSTGIDSASAMVFTGEGSSVDLERPRGLSGRVTTATTSCPSPTSASRGGVANSGVPKKTMRICSLLPSVVCRLPSSKLFVVVRFVFVFARDDDPDQARILRFLVFPFGEQFLPLEEAQVIDEQLAVQVVDLVLKAHAQQLSTHNLERLALAIERLDHDARRARDVAVQLGDREAAFFPLDGPRALDDLRIDEHEPLAVHVHHREPLRAAHLRGGEAHAVRGGHRFEHVVDELLQFGREGVDRAGLLAEDRIAEDADREDAHAAVTSLPLDLITLCTRPRWITTVESPDLMVMRSSSVFTGTPSFSDSLMRIISPTSPPTVTISSPFRSENSEFSCCFRCFCCGRIIRK